MYTTLLTIHIPGGPLELEFPASPSDFATLLGRYTPEVPTDFNCVEISPKLNTVVLSDTAKVTAEIHAVQLRPERMQVLLSYLRGLFPAQFNNADISATNAHFLTAQYLSQ